MITGRKPIDLVSLFSLFHWLCLSFSRHVTFTAKDRPFKVSLLPKLNQPAEHFQNLALTVALMFQRLGTRHCYKPQATSVFFQIVLFFFCFFFKLKLIYRPLITCLASRKSIYRYNNVFTFPLHQARERIALQNGSDFTDIMRGPQQCGP